MFSTSDILKRETAIELIRQMKGDKISELIKEMGKSNEDKSPQKINKLKHQLLVLNDKAKLMIKGDQDEIDSIIKFYSDKQKEKLERKISRANLHQITY